MYRFNRFELFSRIALLFSSIFMVGQVVRYLVGLLFK
jgi:hypothetical protein